MEHIETVEITLKRLKELEKIESLKKGQSIKVFEHYNDDLDYRNEYEVISDSQAIIDITEANTKLYNDNESLKDDKRRYQEMVDDANGSRAVKIFMWVSISFIAAIAYALVRMTG